MLPVRIWRTGLSRNVLARLLATAPRSFDAGSKTEGTTSRPLHRGLRAADGVGRLFLVILLPDDARRVPSSQRGTGDAARRRLRNRFVEIAKRGV